MMVIDARCSISAKHRPEEDWWLVVAGAIYFCVCVWVVVMMWWCWHIKIHISNSAPPQLLFARLCLHLTCQESGCYEGYCFPAKQNELEFVEFGTCAPDMFDFDSQRYPWVFVCEPSYKDTGRGPLFSFDFFECPSRVEMLSKLETTNLQHTFKLDTNSFFLWWYLWCMQQMQAYPQNNISFPKPILIFLKYATNKSRNIYAMSLLKRCYNS